MCLLVGATARAEVDDCTLRAGDNDATVRAGDNDATAELRALAVRCAGGQITIPNGTFTTAPFSLSSHTTLRLAAGALLRGTTNRSAYPLVAVRDWLPSYGVSRDDRSVPPFSDHEHQALLTVGPNATNVTIRGPGTIDGQGEAWWAVRQTTALRHGRPRLVQVHSSTRVALGGDLRLSNSAFWTVHLYRSAGVVLRDVVIRNPKDVDNTDGIDPDSSVDVLIERVNITCGDDAIAVKSGWDAPGLHVGAPARNITVQDCDFDAENGVSIGSEMSGGVQGVTVQRTRMRCFHRGVYVKTAATRGGEVRGVALRDLDIEALEVFAVLRNYSNPNPANPPGFQPPRAARVRDVSFERIVARAVAQPGYDDDGVPTGITAAAQFAGAEDAPLTGLRMADVRVSNDTVGFLCYGPVSSGGVPPTNVTPAPCWE
eukprot:g4324.t1